MRAVLSGVMCAATFSLTGCGCQGDGAESAGSVSPTRTASDGGQQAANAAAAETVPAGLAKWPASRSPTCPSGPITVGCWSSPQIPAKTAIVVRRSVMRSGYAGVTVTCVDPQRYCLLRVRAKTAWFTYRLERLHAHGSDVVSSWSGLRRGTRVWLVAVPA
jgi:hypothetical protein